MIVNIYSASYDARTFAPNQLPCGRLVRVEEINTDSNLLFKGCRTKRDVIEAYEAFWNQPSAPAVVRVIGVEPVGRPVPTGVRRV